MTMNQIIENLRRAIAIVETTSEGTINLDRFQHYAECGTLYCTYGLLAQDPYFQQQGIRIPYVLSGNSDHVDNVFGPWSFEELFAAYGSGMHDKELGAFNEENILTHKQLAMARLNRRLNHMTGVAQ